MNTIDVQRPVLYGDRTRWGLLHADAVDMLRLLPDRSVDAVITDPPYGIAFNDHHWDGGVLTEGTGFETWATTWATELRRILRPGGYIASFGAPRTMHRLVSGLENAGLEIRDQLLWLYGSGMPKSRGLPHDLGTALKPAYEPIVLARAPLDGTTIANLERWGTGVLDIGTTRVRDELADVTTTANVIKRWPANLGLLHSSGCDSGKCEGHCAVRQIDEDAGQPVSRFFYCAKANRQEREAGLEEHQQQVVPIFSKGGRTPRANSHPTVKPLALMRWVTRLIVPPYGVVLDPFAGSGSTGCAAVLEGRQFVGIERESTYVEIARGRLTHWSGR